MSKEKDYRNFYDKFQDIVNDSPEKHEQLMRYYRATAKAGLLFQGIPSKNRPIAVATIPVESEPSITIRMTTKECLIFRNERFTSFHYLDDIDPVDHLLSEIKKSYKVTI